MSDINSNDWIIHEESGRLEWCIHFKDFFSKRSRGFSRKNCPTTILPQYQTIIALIIETQEMAIIRGADYVDEPDGEMLTVLCDSLGEAAQLLALDFLFGNGEDEYDICGELISRLQLA